jgi:hypothetical protein
MWSVHTQLCILYNGSLTTLQYNKFYKPTTHSIISLPARSSQVSLFTYFLKAFLLCYSLESILYSDYDVIVLVLLPSHFVQGFLEI